MKIDINKKYRTRDGREVRLLHRVPEGWPTSYPWRGIASDESRLTWTDHGAQDLGDSPNDDDLIEVREPREWRLWVGPNGDTAVPARGADNLQQRSIDAGWVEIRVREIID